MKVPFLPIVLILSFFWALNNAAYARTTDSPIIDCDKNRDNPVTCTACNIYHEARGQVKPGMLAVALVTRNRVVSPIYPDTFCKAVWQKKMWRVGAKKNCWKEKRCGWSPQFSWTKDGRPDFVYNMDAWVRSLSYAKYVVEGHNAGMPINDITFGAMWYHRAEKQEPKKVMRDEEHNLRWHVWQTAEHAPYWMDDYFPTVKIGDHMFYAKDEETYLEVMESMVASFVVTKSDDKGGLVNVQVQDQHGSYNLQGNVKAD